MVFVDPGFQAPSALLGGRWDFFLTTYDRDYDPTLVGVTTISPFRGIISRVISPVRSSYEVLWASKYPSL